MQAGDLLADRFELEVEVGRGGMGTVFRARDRLSGAPVAVKLLRAANQGAEDEARFLREGTLLESLSHPGIVRHIAHGVSQKRTLYLAMEWLDGVTLSQRLFETGFDLSESVAVLLRLADALAAAHAVKVLHRDLKPTNVLFVGGELERVKLLDFGIARRMLDPKLTTTGVAMGTPGYMSPEQVRGAPLDTRADVFGLGCLLYECVTGVPAFSGEHELAVQTKIMLSDPPAVTLYRDGTPAALARAIDRMLAKDPNARPRDADEVAAELAALGPMPDSGRLPARLLDAETQASAAADPAPPSFVIAVVPPLPGDAGNRAQARIAREGYEVRLLGDGSVLGMVNGPEDTPILAERAAFLALDLKAALPETQVLLASALDHVIRLLGSGAMAWMAETQASAADAVLVDERCADLLDERFEVRREAARSTLHGERRAR